MDGKYFLFGEIQVLPPKDTVNMSKNRGENSVAQNRFSFFWNPPLCSTAPCIILPAANLQLFNTLDLVDSCPNRKVCFGFGTWRRLRRPWRKWKRTTIVTQERHVPLRRNTLTPARLL